jgi:acyl-CoA synthetase (AMP-forming)/AMP-acid ligase II
MDQFKLRFPMQQYPTVSQLFTAMAEKFSSSTYIQYWKDPNDDHPCSLTYREVDIITNNLAHRLQSEYDLHGQAVAYLADHSVQYGLYLIAFVKLGCRVMLISPKNSGPAIVDLMKKTDTKFLFHNKRFAIAASSAIDQIDGGASFLAFDVDIEASKELENGAQNIPVTEESLEDQMERIALIIHSSGTTGFPKPIYLSNQYMLYLLNSFADVFESVESPKILSLAPLYHIMGVVFIGIALLQGTYIFPTNVSRNLQCMAHFVL